MGSHYSKPEPEEDILARRHAMAFLDCLTPEASHYITHIPIYFLSQSQRSTIKRYNDYFNPSTSSTQSIIFSNNSQSSTQEGEEIPEVSAYTDPISQDTSLYIDDNEYDVTGSNDKGRNHSFNNMTPSQITGKPGSRPKQKNASDKKTTSDQSWGAIMTLQSLSLDPDLVELLSENTNANPKGLLALFLDDFLPVEKGSNVVTVQTFPKFCQSVASLPCINNNPRRTVGRLFCHLAVADMASSLFTRKALANEKMNKTFISPQSGKAYDEVKSTIRLADQIYLLCERFGTGSLFILHHELTDHFLMNRVSHSGNFHGHVRSHLLKQLKMDQCIRKNGLEDLGDTIRQALLSIYGHGDGSVVVGEEGEKNG